jgi:hypothetical protein
MILSLHFAGFWGGRVGEHWKGQNTPGKGGWCWVCYLPFPSYFNTILFFFSLLNWFLFQSLYRCCSWVLEYKKDVIDPSDMFLVTFFLC